MRAVRNGQSPVPSDVPCEIDQLAAHGSCQASSDPQPQRPPAWHDELQQPNSHGTTDQQWQQDRDSVVRAEYILYLGERPSLNRHVDGLTPREAPLPVKPRRVMAPGRYLSSQPADGDVSDPCDQPDSHMLIPDICA